jgi:hypothetical protein
LENANGGGSRFRPTTNNMEDAFPENDSRHHRCAGRHAASREVFGNLLVQFLAVRDDQERSVPRNRPQHLLRQEDRQDRFAAALRMPERAHPPLVLLDVMHGPPTQLGRHRVSDFVLRISNFKDTRIVRGSYGRRLDCSPALLETAIGMRGPRRSKKSGYGLSDKLFCWPVRGSPLRCIYRCLRSAT